MTDMAQYLALNGVNVISWVRVQNKFHKENI